MLTRASSFAEAMITDTEVHHTLEFGHQEDVRRDVCNVGDKTGFAPRPQDHNEASNFLTEALENAGHWRRTCNVPPSRRCEALDQGVLQRCE